MVFLLPKRACSLQWKNPCESKQTRLRESGHKWDGKLPSPLHFKTVLAEKEEGKKNPATINDHSKRSALYTKTQAHTLPLQFPAKSIRGVPNTTNTLQHGFDCTDCVRLRRTHALPFGFEFVANHFDNKKNSKGSMTKFATHTQVSAVSAKRNVGRLAYWTELCMQCVYKNLFTPCLENNTP